MSEKKEQQEQQEQQEEKKEKKEKKRFFAGFKEFITKGSVIDLAVGVIIGNAFKAIVNALTEKVIMPTVTYLLGNKSVKDFKTVLKAAEIKDGEVVKAESAIYWGEFIQALLDFFIIALVLFVIVKAAMTFHEKRLEFEAKLAKKNGAEEDAEEEAEAEEQAEEEAAEEPAAEEQNTELLKEIRDLLKEKRE